MKDLKEIFNDYAKRELENMESANERFMTHTFGCILILIMCLGFVLFVLTLPI